MSTFERKHWIRGAWIGTAITVQVWVMLAIFSADGTYSHKVSTAHLIVEWFMTVTACFSGGLFISKFILR